MVLLGVVDDDEPHVPEADFPVEFGQEAFVEEGNLITSSHRRLRRAEPDRPPGRSGDFAVRAAVGFVPLVEGCRGV